ncbi:siderophore ABC transporter substrate-binding protein [Psychrobacter sp. I-STPA6b]|uniref:siderophore ABC transporter substrate-binding protein n=1 Tax=Psychrobacter sp. I-STPA6b TaxID=2585718 RepID=UPI001D0C2DCD|nr:siderophore ABC transporter substrate-binding protein [Psychrobacter sp. I-STPA6b]
MKLSTYFRNFNQFIPSQAVSVALLTVCSASLVACSSPDSNTDSPSQTEQTSQTQADTNTLTNDGDLPTATVNDGQVTLDTVRGEMTVPLNPHPVAVYSMTLMQDLAAMDVPVEGLPEGLLLDNFKAKDSPESAPIGTIFEPNLEALNALQPKAILISNRTAKKYDELNSVAPTLDLSLSFDDLYATSKQRLAQLGVLFDKQAKAQELQQNIDKAIADTQAVTKGRGNGLVISVQGNKLSAFGEDSRFGYIHKQFGIPIADPNIGDAKHGEPISFEYIQKINPDWLLVLDHDSATGETGKNAQAVLDNSLIHQTQAWQKQQVVYLSPDSYLAFGGYYHWLNDAKLIQDAYNKTAQ